ncbi:MAG: T9SS type A sorting domain-containing protein [Chitinophagaceae bacterium]
MLRCRQPVKTTIRVFDARGIVVYQEEFIRMQQLMVKQVNVNNLPKGYYIVEVGIADTNRRTQQFMKM